MIGGCIVGFSLVNEVILRPERVILLLCKLTLADIWLILTKCGKVIGILFVFFTQPILASFAVNGFNGLQTLTLLL